MRALFLLLVSAPGLAGLHGEEVNIATSLALLALVLYQCRVKKLDSGNSKYSRNGFHRLQKLYRCIYSPGDVELQAAIFSNFW